MRKLLLTLLAPVIFIATLSAQHVCGTESPEEVILNDQSLTEQEKAEMLNAIAVERAIEQKQFEKYRNGSRKAAKYTVPVVVHVIHSNGPEKLTDEDVMWTIEQVNLDFSNSNPNRPDIEDEFVAISADMEIDFKLATIDPDGNCTNGIVYHEVQNAYFTTKAPIETIKTQVNWDVTKYFNIYTVGSIQPTAGGNVAGYAQFPNTMNNKYGFVSLYTDFVKNGGTTSGVSTHELGHNFNLFHVWGNVTSAGAAAGCSYDDGIPDTPNTVGNPGGGSIPCNSRAENCGTLDNVQNYMDYSFCFANFTNDQKAKAHLAIDTYLSNLVSPANLIAVGADYDSPSDLASICKARYKVEGYDDVKICPGTQINFKDDSYYKPTSWNWTFEGGTPATSTDQNPSVVYNTTGLYSVTLEVSNASGTVSSTSTDVIEVVEDKGRVFPILEGFEGYSSIGDQTFFTVENPDNNRAFEITNTAAYTGSQSIYLRNRNQGAGNKDVIVSSKLDITAYDNPRDIRFTFKYAFTGRSESHTDVLRVAYSDNCGEKWLPRKTLAGATLQTADPIVTDFTPSDPTEWKEASVTMIGYQLTQDFRFRFEFESSSTGNSLFIDDINIYFKDEIGVAEKEELISNISVYPLPAKQTANIEINVKESAKYTIDVLDLTGRVVANVINETLTAGNHVKEVNVSTFTNGVYFIRVNAGAETAVKRLIVTK